MTHYLSPILKRIVISGSEEWEYSINEFANYLLSHGYNVEIDPDRDLFCITQWCYGDVNGTCTKWSCMLHPLDGHVIIRTGYKIEEDGIRFSPQLVASVPKFIERELLALFTMKEKFVKFPGQVVTMKAKHWPSVNAGMQHSPEIVLLLALVAEVPALAQWFDVTDAGYENIDSQITRDWVEKEKGVILLPYPAIPAVTTYY